MWLETHLLPDARIVVEGAMQEMIIFSPLLEANRTTLEEELMEIMHWGGTERLW